jgi:hypothetical protein
MDAFVIPVMKGRSVNDVPTDTFVCTGSAFQGIASMQRIVMTAILAMAWRLAMTVGSVSQGWPWIVERKESAIRNGASVRVLWAGQDRGVSSVLPVLMT